MGRDIVASTTGAAIYSLSLGITTVALPLLALRADYSATEIGALVSLSAVAQMLSRMGLGAVMRHWPDWTLVALSGLMLAVSNVAVAWSATIVPFVLSQILQGVSRACFWTGTQTHAVRGKGRAASTLATVNLAAGVGLLTGPAIAGILSERSPALALAVAAGVAVVGLVPAALLDRLPPFVPPPDRPSGGIWRRPGVRIGCWAGVTAGGWRGLLNSYVPVALDAARQSASAIGVLVTLANVASLVGTGLAARLRGRWTTPAVVVSIVVTGLATAVTAVVAADVALSALVLGASGLATGVLQVLGLSIASDSVHPEERGEAIAACGTFRAAALLGAPLAVAGLVLAMPFGPAVAVVGVAIGLPAVAFRRRPGTSS